MKSDEFAGETYSCSKWPKEWGINQVKDWFKTPDLYAQHLIYLSEWLQGMRMPGSEYYVSISYFSFSFL
jgi:hypothetical protein